MFEFITQPLTNLLDTFFNFTGSYVVALVILTVLIRLILMYPNYKSFKSQLAVTEKSLGNKEKLRELQSNLSKAKTDEERKEYQLQISQIMMENFSGMKTGCLTALIQFPILSGLYYTITQSNAIQHENFFWFNLGSADIFMTIIAGLTMMIQIYMSVKLADNSHPQMKIMIFMIPLMIVISSIFMPSAIPFYWTISSLWVILQSFVFNKLKPKLTL
ncbi:membrane protein insertase YidC [Lysinibacillus sphaericus]|uniref:Membrane protein insertase YidC n=1 Tax=Lysinibacillus sphaericus TaxID=1421 RepID=A0A544V182_LYSSH|nr:membrane protein insertase YidC [Lysinibacillus sp. SDF0037]TQR39855.1 membrane protein insertase YidC [Lysinibacillus sp. SDF0037]